MSTGEDKINTGETVMIILERRRMVLEKSKAILEYAGQVLEKGEVVWRGATARGCLQRGEGRSHSSSLAKLP